MPEGDNIFRIARSLHRALAGRQVTRFESVLPRLTRVDEDHPVRGRTIESVESRGKHLLMTFSGDLILHTHLRMNGSWHLYKAGERWRRPMRDMRVVIGAGDVTAVGFNLPIAEFLTARMLARHDQLRALGPDPLDPTFDGREVLRRMRTLGEDSIGDVLLNQRVLSGIGNVLKSEVLFVSGLDPATPICELDDIRLEQVIGIARELIGMNVLEPAATLSPSVGRRTTRSLNPGAKLWVYGRAGQPCRRCGTTIRSRKHGIDARITYWCPRCQSRGSTLTRLTAASSP